MNDKGKMIEVEVVKVINSMSGFAPGWVNFYPGFLGLIVVLSPSMENIGVEVNRFDFGVVGIGKAFDFSGGNTFGSSQGDKKIDKFSTKTIVGREKSGGGAFAVGVGNRIVIV